jgi:polyhydroxyalkanoate synthesis regulator phasin
MTDTLDIAQWAKNWEALSRQYQSTFGGSSAQPPWNPSNPFVSQWTDGFAQATRQFAGGKPQNDAIEHLRSAAQGYLGMLQSLAVAAGGQGAGPFADMLKNGFGFASADPALMAHPFANAMRNFGGHGAQGFEQMMERFVAAAGPMLNDAKGLLTLPAFGPLREKQESLQKSAQALIEYQEQNARYSRLMLKVSEQSFARFQLKLAEREEPGRQVDSVRGIYDLWIDAAEEAYAEIALSDEFREVYGALVNAQMRVREHVQREIERVSTDLGIPTRSEVDSIGERLQALRREYRNDKEDAGDLSALTAEVAALRREMAALKSGKPTAAPSNVVEFPRPASPKAVEHAVETPPPVVKKAKPARPLARVVSKAGVPAKKVRHIATKNADEAAKPQTKAKGGKSFAASIARFARDTKSTAIAKPAKPVKSRSGKH